MTDVLFRRKAPAIMGWLMRDFPFEAEDAAAVLGNIGGETGGFRLMQEERPLVKGSRGGFGWCQWTGPRRRAFEAWCERELLEPSSDEANYGYLCVELRGSEKRAIGAVRNAGTLADKVVAFERSFERAGIPHHQARIRWAALALKEYEKANRPAEDVPLPPRRPDIEPETAPEETVPLPPRQPDDPGPQYEPAPPAGFFRRAWRKLTGWATGIGGAGVGFWTDPGLMFWLVAALVSLIVLGALFCLWLFGKERVREFVAKQIRRMVPQ